LGLSCPSPAQRCRFHVSRVSPPHPASDFLKFLFSESKSASCRSSLGPIREVTSKLENIQVEGRRKRQKKKKKKKKRKKPKSQGGEISFKT
jgi:hypothetical protein